MIKISREVAIKALQYLKDQNPRDILDCVVTLMMALEDSNFHTELAKLQEATGLDIRKFYGSKWETVGIELSKMVGWDGLTAAWVVAASMDDLNDKRGFISLLTSAGIDITQSTKKASSASDRVEAELRKTLAQFESSVGSTIKSVVDRYEAYEQDPRVSLDEEGLGAEFGQLQSEYLYLVENASEKLELALKKVKNEVRLIVESTQNLKEGLDRMDRM